MDVTTSLIDNGACITDVDTNSLNTVHHAASEGAINVLKYLLQLDHIGIIIDATDNCGVIK